jgi:ABC-type multidrug transport system fused ATPase/permease subunit
MPIILTLENNYAETLGSSRIFSIFDRGGRAWKDVLSNVAEQITRICIILIPTGYILFQYSPFVALGTIFVLCCIGFFVYLMQKEIEKSKRAKMEAVTEYDRALIKTVQSRFEILQSRALTQELASLDRKNDSYMTLLRAQISRQLMMYQGVRVLSYVILAGAYWFFGHAYLSGSIPLQSVILIASLIGAVSGILFDVTNTYLGLSDQIHSIEHLWEKIEDAPKTPNIFSGPSYTYKGGTIQFD